MNSHLGLCSILLLFCLAGCDTGSKEAPAATKNSSAADPTAVTLFVEPVATVLVEAATESLLHWRKYADYKPALILFSNDPFLTPVPKPLHEQAINLVRNGTPEQIKARAVDVSPNPLLMHPMAVDVALRAGLFSELVWILPLKVDDPMPPLEVFRQKMIDGNLLSQTEAESLTAQDDNFVGTWRGIPVSIAKLTAIPQPKTPALIHFDLSFFKPLYKNEVSTPLYPLVLNSLRKIREADISSIGATISQSNLGGALSLKIRFLAKDLSHLIEHPTSLDEDLPELQFRRTQNLYLEQFMKKEEVLENCLKMEGLAPDDASVKFGLYHANREMQRGNQALEYLEKAVDLDPMYAYEYIYLAETAVEKNRPEAALSMLKKAHETFPDNPLISIMEADINLRLGHRESALKLLDQLQTLPWSEIYDQDVPGRLEQMKKVAENLPAGH